MCILLVAYQVHPQYDLVIAANRDEFYARPTAAAAVWPGQPTLWAGRDLQAGGTWLGVNQRGHFGAVTNLRGGFSPAAGLSRGHLVRDFLQGQEGAETFIDALRPDASRYAGCNLMLSDHSSLWWWSNDAYRRLEPGVYGISNTPLDQAWPKVERLKSAFAPLCHLTGPHLTEALFGILLDGSAIGCVPTVPDLRRLEETIFVRSQSYGTRCSSVVLRSPVEESVDFVERRYTPDAKSAGESRFVIAMLP